MCLSDLYVYTLDGFSAARPKGVIGKLEAGACRNEVKCKVEDTAGRNIK